MNFVTCPKDSQFLKPSKNNYIYYEKYSIQTLSNGTFNKIGIVEIK